MTRYRINRGLFINKEKQGKIMIFNGGVSKFYTFNRTASFIFRRLEKNQSRRTISLSMVRYYGISFDIANKTYEKLIKQLKGENILVPEDYRL